MRSVQLRRRRGLTLMELVVVLTILVGLAAILVPLFPNLLRRTHKATDCTQTSEVAKAIQLYQAAYVSYPDQFDLLTSNSATEVPYLPGASSGTTFGSSTTIAALSSVNGTTVTALDALNSVGIANAWPLSATTPAQPTLNPYSATAPTPLAAATFVRVLNTSSFTPTTPLTSPPIPTEINTILLADPNAKFVVFGVGQRCTAIGKTIMNAPTSVPQDKGFTPDNTYCRVGVIFMVAGNEVEKTGRARFIMAVALEDDELESTEKDIVGYYNVASSP